jgi:hypothetical protein
VTRVTLIVLAVALALANVAFGDPSHPCAVHVARAPAQIRAEIERWLAGESSCNVALEVRVVATEGGYYLLARDVRGRVRERIVPDGASAGVLVASWASDDQLGDDVPPPNLARPAEIDQAGDDDDDTGSDAAPVHAVQEQTFAITSSAYTPKPHDDWPLPSKWLRVDLLVSSAGVAGSGLRAEVDVLQLHGWTAGLAASIATGLDMVPDTLEIPDMMSQLELRDTDALAYVARTGNVTSWLHVRGAFAAGARVTTATLPFIDNQDGVTSGPSSATGVRPTIDASLLVGAELGHGWALELGALVSASSALHVSMPESIGWEQTAVDVQLDTAVGLQLFGGLAHRL